jgi:hypothetical protein
MDYIEIKRKHLNTMNRMGTHSSEEITNKIITQESYKSELTETIQIKHKNRYSNNMCLINIDINKDLLKGYGSFWNNWIEYTTTTETGIENFWYNKTDNLSTWENPIFILLSLIDNNVNTDTIPISWTEQGDTLIIFCKNDKILNLNKSTNKISK